VFGFDDLWLALAIEAQGATCPKPFGMQVIKECWAAGPIVKIHMVPSIFKSFKQFEDNSMPQSFAVQFK